MLGLAASLAKGGASLLTYVKDNLKLYLDFKSSRSDTLAFPSEGSTSFDASGDYIKVPHNDSLNLGTSDFTISFWVKSPSTTGSNMMIVDKYHSDVGFNIDWHTSNKLRIYIKDGTDDYYSYANQTLSFGVWYHFAIVFNATTNKATYYIDGVDVGVSNEDDGNIDSISNTGELTIGASASNGYFFKGLLANLAMWTRSLSPEEVQSVMNKSYSQLGSVEKTSLVMWHSLDQQHLNFNHVVNSVGEDLGSEEFRGSYAPLPYLGSDWEVTGGSASVTEDATTKYVTFQAINNLTTFNAENQFRGGRIEFTSANAGMLTGSAVAEQTYKVVVSGYVSNTNGQSIASYPALYAGSYLGNTSDLWTTEETTKTVYFRASHGSNDTFFPAFNQKYGQAFVLTGISVKKVNGHYGEVTGATTTTSVYGGNAPILPRALDIAESQAEQIGNGSASFDGSSDFVEVADSSILQTNGNMTLTAWINPTGTTSFRVVVMKRDAGGSNYTFYLSDDATPKLRFFDGSTATSSTDTITKDEWQHIALSINSGVTDGSVFYINGIASGTATFTITADDAPFTIGKHQTDDTYYNGEISQVGIWQGALSQAKIQSVMESTSYAKIPASVKSTLGANTLNPPTSSSSEVGWNTDTEVLTFTENRYALWDNATTKNSTLYKFQYEILTRTAGGLAEGGGSSGWSFGTLPDTVGVHTIYKVSRSDATGAGNNSDYLQIQCTGFRGTIGNISMKEVSNDLVGYWGLDADFTDSTDNKNDGFKGVGITGNSTRLKVPHHSDFDVESGEGFAAGGWIKVNTYADSRWFIGKGTGAWSPTTTNGWSISAASSPQYWYSHLKSGGSNLERSNANGAGNVDKWLFMGIGRDGDGQGFKLSSSGRTDNGSKAGALTNTSAIYIGAAQSGNAIVSDIQQVFYFNKTLTQAESLELYNGGKPLRFEDLSSSLKSNCKLWLPLEGDLNDVSGNGHNAEGF